MNQNQRILEHMEKHGPITGKLANDLYGIERLGARIYDLRKAGFDIRDGWADGKNRYGEKTRFKEYWIRKGVS